MSDDELYSRFLAGEMSAADQLMIKYMGQLIMYLDAIIHDIRDAEDLVIETFAVILTKHPSIREGGFRAYLYRAARNRALRFRIRKRRMNIFILEENIGEELLSVQTEDEFFRDERRHAVLKCLNRIDPDCREALWLTFFEGLSYAEAAAVMGINVKKVDNLLIKGKQRMRTELAKEGITRVEEA
ncbi:MAG: RNA polymerase sigma factor [Clostridia bacterium]|nr:RNA polymerase sigma factor [Clostridia bacterium]